MLCPVERLQMVASPPRYPDGFSRTQTKYLPYFVSQVPIAWYFVLPSSPASQYCLTTDDLLVLKYPVKTLLLGRIWGILSYLDFVIGVVSLQHIVHRSRPLLNPSVSHLFGPSSVLWSTHSWRVGQSVSHVFAGPSNVLSTSLPRLPDRCRRHPLSTGISRWWKGGDEVEVGETWVGDTSLLCE